VEREACEYEMVRQRKEQVYQVKKRLPIGRHLHRQPPPLKREEAPMHVENLVDKI